MHIVDKNGSKFESFLMRRKLAFLFKEKMLFADVHWVIHAFDSYEKNNEKTKSLWAFFGTLQCSPSLFDNRIGLVGNEVI